VQHGGPESVDSVMVDGRWLMRGQALLAFDEAAALTEAEAAVAGLQERTAAQLATLDATLPALGSGATAQLAAATWPALRGYLSRDAQHPSSGDVLIDSPIEIGRLPARFVPAEQQDEILMLLRLDRPFWNSSQSAAGTSRRIARPRPSTACHDPSNRRLRRD